MFFDFGGKYPFEKKVEELVREIHRTLDNAVPSKVNVTHASYKDMPGRVCLFNFGIHYILTFIVFKKKFDTAHNKTFKLQ